MKVQLIISVELFIGVCIVRLTLNAIALLCREHLRSGPSRCASLSSTGCSDGNSHMARRCAWCTAPRLHYAITPTHCCVPFVALCIAVHVFLHSLRSLDACLIDAVTQMCGSATSKPAPDVVPCLIQVVWMHSGFGIKCPCILYDQLYNLSARA